MALKKAVSGKRAQVAPEKVPQKDLSGQIQFARAMVDPATAETNGGCPALIPYKRTCVTEQIAVGLSGIANNVVECFARPEATLVVSDSTTNPASGLPFRFVPGIDIVVAGSATLTYGQGFVGQGSVYADQKAATPGLCGGNPYYEVAGSGALKIDISFLKASNQSAACVMLFYAADGTTLVHTANMSLPGFSSQTVPPTAAYATIGLRYASGVGNFAFQVKCQPDGSTWAIASNAKSYDLTTFSQVPKLRSYRIVGQSLRVTYTGSPLTSGGTLAIARVYSGWAPEPGQSVFDAICKLPSNLFYRGPTRKGGHVFWVPASVADLDPGVYSGSSYTDKHPSQHLICAFSMDDDTQSCDVVVDTIVEYYTDAASLASRDYAPAWNNFDAVLLLLSEINPASENPAHLDKAKIVISKAFRAALNYLRKNPHKVAEAVAMLASIA